MNTFLLMGLTCAGSLRCSTVKGYKQACRHRSGAHQCVLEPAGANTQASLSLQSTCTHPWQKSFRLLSPLSHDVCIHNVYRFLADKAERGDMSRGEKQRNYCLRMEQNEITARLKKAWEEMQGICWHQPADVPLLVVEDELEVCCWVDIWSLRTNLSAVDGVK